MNLGSKTTLLVTAIVTSVMVAVSLLFLYYQEESLKHNIIEGLDGQAQISVPGIESFVEEGLKGARAIAANLPVRDLVHGRYDTVKAHLKQMLDVYPNFRNGVFILDRDGRFLTDYPSHDELRGQSFAFREYFQRTIMEKRGIVGKPYKSVRTGLPVLTFTSPLHDDKGRLVALLACSVDLLAEDALGGYHKQKFGKTGYLYIFDRSRLLILHPEESRMLTNVEAGRNRILEAALSGFEGGAETVNSQGVPMLLSVRQLPKAQWIVAVQVTQAEAYAPVAEMRIRIVSMAVVAILLVVVTGALAIRRVTRPLQQLEHVASRISAGLEDTGTGGSYEPEESVIKNLNSIRSRDEIGLLASSFQSLTMRLKLTLGSLQRSAEDWQRTFNSVNEAVVTLDMESRILMMNHAAEAWFRTSMRDVRGKHAYRLLFDTSIPPRDWPDLSTLSDHQKVRWSRRLSKPQGIFEFTITPVSGAAGIGIVGAVLVISDVTERVEWEEHIREMAFYDQLTGLPNRFLLQDRIRLSIASAVRSKKKAGIMFLDLDRFKEVNDRYGHDVGDELLKQVAGHISGCLRRNDTLARMGGDEFVVVLHDIDTRQEAADIADRILRLQSSPVSVFGQQLHVSSSIGIALFPDDGEDAATLLKYADMAMYRAKGMGRNNFQFYFPEPAIGDNAPTS